MTKISECIVGLPVIAGGYIGNIAGIWCRGYGDDRVKVVVKFFDNALKKELVRFHFSDVGLIKE